MATKEPYHRRAPIQPLEVLLFTEAAGWISPNLIVRMYADQDITKQKASKYLQSLTHHGHLTKIDHGVYTLPG